jgi:hypothetical protein
VSCGRYLHYHFVLILHKSASVGLLYLTILVILGEDYRLWNCSLRIFPVLRIVRLFYSKYLQQNFVFKYPVPFTVTFA